MYRLLIVESEKLLRDELKKCIVWKYLGINFIEEATNGEEALQIIKKSRPEIVITEIRLHGMDGIELMQIIKETKLNCKVIVLSNFDEFKYVQQALINGAVDYLLKPVQQGDLIKSIKTCISNIDDERKKFQEVGSFVYDIINKNHYDIIATVNKENTYFDIKALINGKIK